MGGHVIGLPVQALRWARFPAPAPWPASTRGRPHPGQPQQPAEPVREAADCQGSRTEEEPLGFLASLQLSSEGPDPVLPNLDTPLPAMPAVKVTVLAQEP